MVTTDPRRVLAGYGVAVTSVYMYTVYPSIPGGDSGELIQAAHELGVAHAPGYPLFTMLCWVTMKFIPFGTIAWRTNLLTALLSGAASTILALTIHKYTDNVWVSLAGCTLWSFSYLTWTWSAQTDVFGLNNLFVAAILYLMVEFQTVPSDRRKRVAFVGCFVCGLSLCNQHTIVIYVGIVALWVLLELWNQKGLDIRTLLTMVLAFILGLTPYIYLPLSSILKLGRWTLGDQSTLRGFLSHLFRMEYGTFDLAKGKERGRDAFLMSLRAYFSHVTDDLGTVMCLFGILPVLVRFKLKCSSMRRPLVVTTTMALVYITFFCWRANLKVDRHTLDRGVVERFWMQCDMVIVLLISVGMALLLNWIEGRYPGISTQKLSAYIFIYAFSTQFISGIQICNHSNNTVIAEYGLRMIRNMPNNSLVLLRGDLPSNVIRYFYLCENERPDLEVFDVEVMGSRYGVGMLREKYPGIHFPPGERLSEVGGVLKDGTLVFDIKTFLDLNYDRFPAVINCHTFYPTHKTWETKYIRYPFGNCMKIIKNGDPVEFNLMHSQTDPIHNGWPYHFAEFDRSTWENAATRDIWNSKLSLAEKLFEDSELMTDNATKHKLQMRSLKLYNLHMESERKKWRTIPAYWHRNYAIILYTLLKRDLAEGADIFRQPAGDVIDLIKVNFNLYNSLEPNNEDRSEIERTIAKLQTAIEVYTSTGMWDIA